jgi:cell division protein ZapA
MSELSIKVEIAGRSYPLSVQREEEETVRKAAALINDSVGKLKAAYPMTDIQDLLSMAALEVATRSMNSAGMADRKELEGELDELERLLGQESQA